MSVLNKTTNPTTNSIELQLGDVLKITSPLNDVTNDNTFIIEYIDQLKIYLINTDTFDRIRLPISEDGLLGDGNITQIAILSRSDTPSYALQNGLTSGKWVNIYFEGDFPVIITGEITNVENDMIEVKTTDGDTIYINFDYKGIPEELPIKLFEIRDKPSDPLTQQRETQEKSGLKDDEDYYDDDSDDDNDNDEDQGDVKEPEELSKENVFVDPKTIQISVPIKDIKNKIREFIVRADQVTFGKEVFGPVVQMNDVSLKGHRFSLETQVTDLLDDMLSTVPNHKRTPRVLNDIHIMIDRFKQLREKFSRFDEFENVEGKLVKESNYKPLLAYFKDFKKNLYWILPVVKNVKKIYGTEIDVESYSDVINIEVDADSAKINEIIENYKSDDLPDGENKYAALYSSLNPYFTPFDNVDDEKPADVIADKEVFDNINTIVNNLEDMYSSIFTGNSVRNRRFVMQKYNTALTKLDTIESTGSKQVTVRTNIGSNDIMSINSFITLPEPVIRFSRVNLPTSNILDKASLNLSFLNYWQLFKKNTNVNSLFVDLNEDKMSFNEDNFATNIKNYVLNDTDEVKNMTQIEIYETFVKNFIPKTKIIFNLMKKYITGKLSIVDVVSYLEPFLIYPDDLTFMQYKDITTFINEKISEQNKKFIERSRFFKTLGKNLGASVILNEDSIWSIINSEYREKILFDSYDIQMSIQKTNSEMLRKITMCDRNQLYATTLAVQNFPLLFPAEYSDIFNQEKMKKTADLSQQDGDGCKPFIVAKYYKTVEELKGDDDTTVYFDKKYDKTNYGILEDPKGYEKAVFTMSPDELLSHISEDLIRNKKMSEKDAKYLANTLTDGYKTVIDGQYAILYKGYNENTADEVEYYVREGNKWVLDGEMNKEKIYTDDPSVLCDIQQQCINVTSKTGDKCESMKEDETGIQIKLLSDMIGEFDEKYKLTSEQLKTSITEEYNYHLDVFAALLKLESTELLKYNNARYKMGLNVGERTPMEISPHQDLLDTMLQENDYLTKQQNIIRFVNKFTRPSMEAPGVNGLTEDPKWLYCVKSGAQLIPAFKKDLAFSFISFLPDYAKTDEIEVSSKYQNYIEVLESVKKNIGEKSDDGDWWVDKHTGWSICPIDFDVEEGYEDGFRVSTRSAMEEDAGNKLMSSLVGKQIKYDTPETITINMIVNSLSFEMGINIENQKEFVINCVLSAMKEMETEDDYKVKMREMSERGKKIMSYKDLYNNTILYYTFGMFLIAVQTSVPSVKTRKTYPGCVRSFEGYPMEGTGDLSSLTYLGCVVYDLRSSTQPWNVLKGKKKEVIIGKIKTIIDGALISLPEVIRKMEEKTVYLLTSPASEIPTEHDIAKWKQFLPPLVNFTIKQLTNISPDFKRSLKNELRSGLNSQHERILVVQSKIIKHSLALIERIQEIVKQNKLILHTSGNEPYLENACCEGKTKEKTIDYFINKDKSIADYNEIVKQLSDMLEDIKSHSTAEMLCSATNTKNIYPSINPEFGEKTIYMSYIHFCKFKSLMPVPQELLPFCGEKPEEGIINPSDSIDRIIQKLKDTGRNYENDKFLRLLQIIAQHNIVNIKTHDLDISSITRFKHLLDILADEHDEYEIVEKELRDLIKNSTDTFEFATEDYTTEVKRLNNFVSKQNEEMKTEISQFIKINKGSNITASSIRKMEKNIETMSEWSCDLSTRNENIKISNDKLYNIVNFYKNFIYNVSTIYPNIILNKVNYDNVQMPKYYGFSDKHSFKITKSIRDNYDNLKPFYGVSSLENVLSYIQKTTKSLVKVSKFTPSFTSLKVDEDVILKPLFDERTSRLLFEYYLLRIFINYIELTDKDAMIVTEKTTDVEVTDIVAAEYLTETNTRMDISLPENKQQRTQLLSGNKMELRTKVAHMLISFIEMFEEQKEIADNSYEDVEDRNFKLREREKNMVTDRLKKLTDEQRDADTIFKINKLGMYSKGNMKGLTVLDAGFYDEEQSFRDEILKAEKNIRKKNSDANDNTMDILLDEYEETSRRDAEIDREENDMSYMDEDYLDGRTDGAGASEEYDDNDA